jgi:hypothetical protein
MVRAKFICQSIKVYAYGAREMRLIAAYDDVTPENQRFSKDTPSGTLTITVDNPSAAAFFIPGQAYYLDLTKA